MDGRKVFLLIGALVVAAITAFMARSLMAGSSAPQASAVGVTVAQPDGPRVLVATKALPIGTIIDPTALRFQPWPKELIDNAYYKEGQADMKTVVGTVVRNPITAGQPVTQGALVKPGDRGFLAAALGPGMRAVTVPVSAQSGVSGFVFPGDRVDIVLTQSVAGGGDGLPLKVSETILRNVRVLATDTRTDKSVDDTGKTVVTPTNFVTFESTPKMAEKIAVAQTVGSLSLSLRPLADDTQELEEAIAAGGVSVPSDPKAEKQMLLQMASRPIEGGSTFSTGADVSRFQRSTVPGKPGFGAMSGQLAPSLPAGSAGPAAGLPVEGPVVRIARGNSITIVPVGGKN